jgi:DNA-binding CsgD family transcriptional regulator
MAKQSVTIEGVEYKSRTAAARALVESGKTLSEAAAATGMTYQTVYANTKGLEKVNTRRAKYRVLALGRKGKRSASEIAQKTGMSVPRVVALLKKNSIVIVTKEAAQAAKKAKAGKTAKVKTPKAKPVVDEVPMTPAQVVAEDELPEDAMAAAAAMADMAKN